MNNVQNYASEGILKISLKIQVKRSRTVVKSRSDHVEWTKLDWIDNWTLLYQGLMGHAHSAIYTRHGTGSLGHRVNGSFGSSFTSGSPCHRVIISTRCETRVFPVFEKMPKMQKYIWNAEMTKVVVRCLLLDWNHWMSVHANKLLLLPTIIKNSLVWEYFFTHKSTFGVHYRTGSPGQLGLRVARFPGHWVAGSQNVTQFHLWSILGTDRRE